MKITVNRRTFDTIIKVLMLKNECYQYINSDLAYDIIKSCSDDPGYDDVIFNITEENFDDMICALVNNEYTDIAYYLVRNFK